LENRNYAAVAADTFSSELGILSKHEPRLITAPWVRVPKGTNGGVTFAGLTAGFGGAFLIAMTSLFTLPLCFDWDRSAKIRYVLAITFAGFCGTLLDSWIGAVFQASVVDVNSGKIVEGDGGRKVLLHSTSPVHLKPSAKVRSEVISNEDAAGSVAKRSALEDSSDTPRKRAAEEEDDSDDEEEHHESRKILVGFNLLDNNAVNFLMAATVSYWTIAITAYTWGIKLNKAFET
jgi:uncharacterized membrane protein